MTVGRLVVPAIRWRAETGFSHEDGAIEAALRAGVGGFIIFGGPATDVAHLVTRIRRDAGRPLVFGADLERGAGQQFLGLREVPPPAALSSLGDLGAIEAAGLTTGVDARSVGIDWVYAPVADLDLEPENPIVQTRAFGADPDRVGREVAAWIAGARAAGVLSCAKHFPGHGRTTRDSHDHLGQVGANRADLEAADLIPFQAAIEAGVDSIMTCHVAFPALDPSGRPATLSRPMLDRLRELGFRGLVVSDALIMEAIKAGGVDPAVAAIEAGVDVLLYPPEPIATIRALEARAGRDPAFARVVAGALERLEAAMARLGGAARSGGSGLAVEPIADRIVAVAAPDVRLRPPIDLILADDDLDGAFPASSSDYLRAALCRLGVACGPGGSRVLVAFAEPRASKGRGGFGPRTRAIITDAADAELAVLFTHRRLAAELPVGMPVLIGWHRQRLMQEAAARWLAGRIQ
jgi:beta-glucosidase-like glycosyl hydrolase